MVSGLPIFAQAFSADRDQYVLIGGGAVHLHLENAGLRTRATKDLDLVLTAHALNEGFVRRFWTFLIAGGYESWQRGEGEPVRYRFMNPKQADYPDMLELLGRPLGDPPEGQTIALMPTGEDLSDLSVIVLEPDIFEVVRNQRQVMEGVSCLSPWGLILLKARAFLDLSAKRETGNAVRSSDIRKHRNDVFRMSALLASDQDCPAPDSTRETLARFLDSVETDEESHPNILASLEGLPGGSMVERIQELRALAFD